MGEDVEKWDVGAVQYLGRGTKHRICFYILRNCTGLLRFFPVGEGVVSGANWRNRGLYTAFCVLARMEGGGVPCFIVGFVIETMRNNVLQTEQAHCFSGLSRTCQAN